LQILESRLDNVSYRMGFGGSRSEARQTVRHNGILVNGKRVNIPSYQVRPGDVVEVAEASRSQLRLKSAVAAAEQRGFPEWMFDADPWNDLLYLLNARTVEIAGRRLGYALGLAHARWPGNGYEVFTPPESMYDLAKAQAKIYGNGPRRIPPRQDPAYVAAASERGAWTFPALAWLEEIIAKGRWQRVLLVFMPVHQAAQPRAGSAAAAREAECKWRIALLAAQAGWPALDFRIASGITTVDSNYWDALHYRLDIAERVARGIERGITSTGDDPNGDWRHLWADGDPALARHVDRLD